MRMKKINKESAYKFSSIFLFLLLISVIYDRVRIANELEEMNSKISFERNMNSTKSNSQNSEILKTIEQVNAELYQAELRKNRYDNLLLREEGKLADYLGNLFRFSVGEHYVEDPVIKKFSVEDNIINVFLENNTNQAIQPKFIIYFLNEYGFITGSYQDEYIFSSISPGETRSSQGSIKFNFGIPYYYSFVIEY